jgi:lipopolysaccharide export system protein LptA
MKWLTYTISLIMMGLLAHLASAQMFGEFKGKRGPVHITSQQLEAEYEKKLITFIGDVVVKQEDFVLYADRLLLFLNDETEGIEKIVAQGNVRMIQGDKEANCREATYYYEEGRVVLHGNPEVQGTERVTITIMPREVKK